MRKLIFFIALVSSLKSYSQQALLGFVPAQDIRVYHNGDSLKMPWAGGMNHMVVNSMDLNNDGVEDLLLFDKYSKKIMPFVVTGSGNNASYKYAPEYASSFPRPEDWILLRDFNCDGKKDIFFNINQNASAIYVYENTSSGGNISFSPANNGEYLKTRGTGQSYNLFSSGANLSAILDYDGDGDIDILSYGSGGTRLQLHENVGGCGSFDYKITRDCLGEFEESSFYRTLNLGACTNGKTEKVQHEGSAFLIKDLNNDGLLDMVAGNVNFPNITAAFNGGTSDTAKFTTQDTLYPSNSVPVNTWAFAAPYAEDGNFDGKTDLFFSPYLSDLGSMDNHSLWYYKNTATNGSITPVLETKAFLQEDMIDLGTGAFPTLVDLNGDGLLDLIVSNKQYRVDSLNSKYMVFYYENTGSTTQPEFTLIDTNFLNYNTMHLGSDPMFAFGDLDSDGDLDIILGVQQGTVHYFENTGSSTNAIFANSPDMIFVNGIDVGGYAAPNLYDVDNDGDLDLLIGNQNGAVQLWENSDSINFNFSLVTENYGGVFSRNLSIPTDNGYAVPRMIDYLGKPVLVTGSESKGLLVFDSIESVTSKGSYLTALLDGGTQTSSGANETPFATTKYNGRHQYLITRAELQSFGFVYGYINSINFELKSGNGQMLEQGFNISMKNTSATELNGFEQGLTGVAYGKRISGPGWNGIDFTTPFLYDGQSNIVIEICFSGNYMLKSSDKNLSMQTTSFKSHAYGDLTNYNQLGKDGCSMPYGGNSYLRPNMRLNLVPTFYTNQEFLYTGERTAPALGDLNGDGFADLIAGNSSGGLRLFWGTPYDSSVTINESYQALSLFELYPNPSNSIFHIKKGNNQPAEIMIYNLSGHLIKSLSTNSSLTEINLKGYSKGIYLVMLREGEMVETKKLILE